MFRKILIANRGEIALRIVRTCREMNIRTVAVYSTADADDLAVQFANESVCIGEAPSAQSYLNMDNIITAALCTGCDAIHPGYGFLSENAEFARLCEENGLVFIGPESQTIEMLGDKARARALVAQHGVPVVPGSDGAVADSASAHAVAQRVEYPVLLKAAAGGGGRGMRRVDRDEDLDASLDEARAEARACFGDDTMYVEKLIVNPRHVEFQILADREGHIVHLGERDCSVQRNHQKMIEESPSPALDESLREEMGQAAIVVAAAAHYRSAGTVEFVLSGRNFYFIEMNTRIQVEHPVTEMRCGCDLIKEQIRIAAGLRLPFIQSQVDMRGHAIECRINAEDPQHGFRPCPGTVEFLHLPGGNGIRVDSGLYAGGAISPFYDSMIGKVIVWAPTRLEAIRKMRRALEEMTIEGVDTNLDVVHLIMFNGDFLRGSYNTGFIEKHLDELLDIARLTEKVETGAVDMSAEHRKDE
jgi:acetyl-CoA carboxylase biotin carboxylase subunit